MSGLIRALAASFVACSVVGWYVVAGDHRPAAADETPRWRMPLDGSPQVLRRFEPPDTRWSAGHRGVDLAARPGQPVYAAGPGRVGYAGTVAGRGVVTVVHGAVRTTYLPVDPSVPAGLRVGPGDRLGVVEERVAHCAPDHCLHWGLLRGSEYLDPLGLVGIGPVRLLPFWGKPPPAGATSDGPRGPPSPDSREAGRRATPSAGPPGHAGSESGDGGFSLVGSAAVGSGSAGLTGLALALGALFARRRARRPVQLPKGVIDLGHERARRRHRAYVCYDDRPPC